jgi:Phage gp6-like head-tail connector protein
MDITQVKNLTGIKTDNHDSYIAEALPLFIEHAKHECNNTFMVEGVEELPSGVQLYVAKAIEFNIGPSNIKGRTMGEVSYSFETELPKSITKFLKPYKRLRFK